jgi:hypothetical protein
MYVPFPGANSRSKQFFGASEEAGQATLACEGGRLLGRGGHRRDFREGEEGVAFEFVVTQRAGLCESGFRARWIAVAAGKSEQRVDRALPIARFLGQRERPGGVRQGALSIALTKAALGTMTQCIAEELADPGGLRDGYRADKDGERLPVPTQCGEREADVGETRGFALAIPDVELRPEGILVES